MSPKRQPAAPPGLPGFTYIDVLGSGGFADVYLYEQHLPKRRVAVKVLLTERMTTGAVAEFTAEANVMAMLSTHPAIVTIYQAGVADDGRPYLVMEYCPKPNLQVRYRRERFSVAEALRVGVQVAGAVETAHRAGVLHRDIKPANILVTEYNRPALTDFGIASTTNAAAESAGLSIPWSPPESFSDIPFSDARSDVWALGATVYSLLAGRSPFEVPGQRNGAADLIHRIETQPLSAIDRQDVPPSLRGALERAMAKPAGARFDTALAFARALQKVQIELALGVTPVDILDDGLPEEVEEDEDDGLTRVRGVVSIDPQTSPAAGLTRASAATRPGHATGPTQPAYTVPAVPAAPASAAWESPVADETVLRGSAPATAPVAPAPFTGLEAMDETMARTPAIAPAPPGPAASAGPAEASRPGRRLGLWLGVGIPVVALIAGGIVAASVFASPKPAPSHTAAQSADPQDVLPGTVAAPTGLAGVVKGKQVVFTWKNPDPAKDDTFQWQLKTAANDQPTRPTDKTTVTVPKAAGGPTCIGVTTVRADGSYSDETRGCVP